MSLNVIKVWAFSFFSIVILNDASNWVVYWLVFYLYSLVFIKWDCLGT